MTPQQILARSATAKADYAKNPLLCLVCGAPIPYRRFRQGVSHCSRVCCTITTTRKLKSIVRS